LCDQAIALDPGERRPFLDEACAGDAALRRDVESLLAHEVRASTFLRPSTLGALAHAVLGEQSGAPAGNSPTETRPPTFQPDELISGRFRIVNLIGAGGMGEVYEVEDRLLGGEHVALKTLPALAAAEDRAVQRLKNEIAAARHVTHSNVCRVFDVDQHGTPDGTITFFTMELLQGETLAARLKERGRIDRKTAHELLTQMAAGLGAVHAAGIVHGDFKPGNVMIVPARDGHERVVVTDFGLARKARGDDDTARATTSTHAAWGTPAYMAPEQLEGRGVTPATDIYALAIVAREMVTCGAQSGPASVEDLDTQWHKSIERCLERDPARRFKTAPDFVRALDAPVEARPRRRTWAAGLTAAAAAAVILVSPSIRTILSRPSVAGNVTAASRVVAVLPFTSESVTPEDQAYGRGLAAALTEELRLAAQLEGGGQRQLLVVPAAEVLDVGFKTAKEAQRTLSANLLLTGRVERVDGRTAISVMVDHSEATSPTSSLRVEAGAGAPLLASSAIVQLAEVLGLGIGPRTLDTLRSRGSSVRLAEESYLLGKGLLTGGGANLDAAVDAFQQAIRLDQTYALALASLGDAYLRQYYLTRDAAFLARSGASGDAAIAQDAALAYAHVVRGRAYHASGQTERAIREFRTALELEPDIVDARRGLAEAYESEGDLQAAEAVYREEIGAYTHYWSPHVMYGSFLIKHGRYREAETSLVNGLRYAPDNTRAIGNLAGLYILTERLAAAEAELQRGLALKPEVVVCNNLAWVNIYQGKFPEAVKLMEQAVGLPLADSFHWGNLARTYRWAGRRDRAADTYDKAIALARKELSHNPRDARIRGNFAQMLAETGHAAEARVEIASTRQRAPTDVSVLFRSGLVSELTGDRDGALQALEAAVQGGYSLVDIRRHPDLAGLRTDHRYVEIMTTVGKSAAQ
jgi:tetratricopeptide (TPR) repeat protein